MKLSLLTTVFFWFRVGISACVVCFATAYTGAAMLLGVTRLKVTGALLSLLLFLLFWMSLLESAQIAMLAAYRAYKLVPAPCPDSVWYKRCVELLVSGDSLERFVLGRQLLVVMIVFVVARLMIVREPYPEDTAYPLNISDPIVLWIAQHGFFTVIITVVFFQQLTQVLASIKPEAFASTPLQYYMVLKASVWTESLGVLHLAYLPRVFGGESGDSLHHRSLHGLGFWARASVSALLWVCAAVCVFGSVVQGMTRTITNTVTGDVVLLLVLWLLVCWLEAVQVAVAGLSVGVPRDVPAAMLLAQDSIPEENTHNEQQSMAEDEADLLETAEADVLGSLKPTGLQDNVDPVKPPPTVPVDRKALGRFFMGRQVLIAALMFFLTGLCATAPATRNRTGETLFGIPQGVQVALLESGVCGAFFLVIGQLAFRVLAVLRPTLVLSIPFVSTFSVVFCLAIELIGVSHIVHPLVSLWESLSPAATSRSRASSLSAGSTNEADVVEEKA